MPKIRLGPDGVHIFNRESGVNVLLDDFIPPEETWTSSPRQVSIALTNACDLDCLHCYAPKRTARLKLAAVKQWMLELDEAGCFGIGFGGGEPTLYPNFLDICHFGKNETNLAVTMTTHGHGLTAPFVSSLEETVNFLRVSMDGVYETYEKLRGRSFLSLLERLDLLGGRIPFGVNYVVNEHTFSDLPKAVKIAERYQAAEFLILPEEGYGKGVAVRRQILSQLSDWILSYSGRVQLSISSKYQQLARLDPILPNEKEEISFAHISASGVLKRNSFEKQGQIIDGDGVMSAFDKLIKLGKPV